MGRYSTHGKLPITGGPGGEDAIAPPTPGP